MEICKFEKMPYFLYDHKTDKKLFENNFKSVLNDRCTTFVLGIRYGSPEIEYISPNGSRRFSFANNIPSLNNYYKNDHYVGGLLKWECSAWFKKDILSREERTEKNGYILTMDSASHLTQIAVSRMFREHIGNDGDGAQFVVFSPCLGTFFACASTNVISRGCFKYDLEFSNRIYEELKQIHGKVLIPNLEHCDVVPRWYVHWYDSENNQEGEQ